MGEQRSSAEALAEIIRGHYDLGEVQVPELLEAAHQRRHRKLVVGTDKGKFLVKTYKRDDKILDSLRAQHRLSEHLEKNHLPVARIQPARNGKRIVESDDWAIELQAFIVGEPMRITANSLIVSAKALGKFHHVCRDFPRPERDTTMWRFSEVPREIFAKLYDLAVKDGDPTKVDGECNRIALFLREAGVALDEEARSKFETGLIHGDWHGGNLIFDGDRLAGIVDLEFSGDGCFLEDLAYAMSNLCIRTSTDTERLRIRTELLIENYQQFRTLSPIEERALSYAVGIKHVATVAFQTVQHDGTVAGRSPADWMERLAFQCEWLAERANRIRWGT